MGWDDSDEEIDVEAIAKQMEEKKKEDDKQKRREEGLSSDSEKEEVAAPKAAAKPKPKPKVKKEEKKKEEEPELTAEERKLRQRKLEEESDARLASDLFSGCDDAAEAKQLQAEKKKNDEEKKKVEAAASKPKVVVVDTFEKVELSLQADVVSLTDKCVQKVGEGKCKNGASIFCTSILKQLEDTLTTEELNGIEKILADLLKQKAVQKTEAVTKENKANTKLNKNTKFNVHGEWEDKFGGGAGDEDWSQEEWDEWQKSQDGDAAAAANSRPVGAKW